MVQTGLFMSKEFKEEISPPASPVSSEILSVEAKLDTAQYNFPRDTSLDAFLQK